MPNPNRTYGYRRPRKERTEQVQRIISERPKESFVSKVVNKVKDVARGAGKVLDEFVNGSGGNTAPSTRDTNVKPPVKPKAPPVPHVQPEVRDGFKQSQGGFNSLNYRSMSQANRFNNLGVSPLERMQQDRDAKLKQSLERKKAEAERKKRAEQAEEYLKIIDGMYQGKYSYGVTQQEWDEWHKKAFKKTGEYLVDEKGDFILDENGQKIPEEVLRPDAPPPPMGTDEATYKRWQDKNTYLTQVQDSKTGEWKDTRYLIEGAEDVPVTTDEFKKYWDWYLKYNNDLLEEQKRAEAESYHMAGTHPEEADSLLDVMRNFLGHKHEDPVTGTIKYFKNYVWNPLKKGDWGTLGLNTLVNLGETMDTFAVGLRATVASGDHLKYGGGVSFTGQNEFVYSGGDDKQKELMKHGADKLINMHEGRGSERNRLMYEKIKGELTKAGLWEDYLQMKREWREHDNEGSIRENLAKAYTDPESNFNADTGSVAKDMLVETILDPTLLVGGFAGKAASSGAKEATRAALKSAAKDFGSKEVVDFVESGNKAVKQYLKGAGEGLLTQNKQTIERNAMNLAKKMLDEGQLTKSNQFDFVHAVTSAIGEVKDNKQYRFIQSMHKVDDMANKLDSALLKTSLAVPYTPYKTVSMIKKTLRNNEKFANWLGSSKGLKEKQAMANLFDGLKDADGNVSIGKFDTVLARMEDDVVFRNTPELQTEVINDLEYQVSNYMAGLEELSSQLAKGEFSPNEFDEFLGDRLRRISNDEIKSLDDLSDFFNNMFHSRSYKYHGKLDNMKQIVDQQIKDIDNYKRNSVDNFLKKFHEDLGKANTLQDLQDITIRFQRFSSSLDNPVKYQNKILNKLNQLDSGEYESLDDFLRQFELEDSISAKKASSVITDLLKNMDEPSKQLNRLHPKFYDQLKSFCDEFGNIMGSSVRVVDGKTVEALGEDRKIFDLLFDGADWNIRDVNPRELHEALTFAIRQKYFKRVSNVHVFAEEDGILLDAYRKLDEALVDMQLNVSTSDSRELLDVHCDLFNVYDKYTGDPRFVRFISFFEQKDGVIEQVEKIHRFLLDLQNESMPPYVADTMNYFKGLTESVQDFKKQAEAVGAYNNLCVRLKQIPDLSGDQYWTVLDALFGFTKNNPKDFFVKNSRNLNNLIDKINLNMDTLFGKARVSLDGFRNEARDFNSELWSDYADEIADPVIRKRVDTILSDGHINPTRDVQTQILQLILRDKGAIDYYNSLAKKQDVLFTDIETQGLSSGVHQITDVSYLRWDPEVLSKNSSLEEILDYLDGMNGNRYTAKYTSEEIDRVMTTDALRGLFPNEPNAGRSELLVKYKEVYGVDNAGSVVKEEDILKRFMGDLDRSFDARGNSSPVLVTHSSRGFDINFISDRVRFYKDANINLFPSHIAHMQDIIDASESTVVRLKNKIDDNILTSAQESLIKDAVVSYAYEMPAYISDFRVLDPNVYSDFISILKDYDKLDMDSFVEFLQSSKKVNPEIQGRFDKLKSISVSDEYKKCLDEYEALSKDVFYDTKRFNGNLLYDPYPESNLFKEAFDASDNGSVPEVGYRRVGQDVSKYFDLESVTEVPYEILTGCTEFMKHVDNVVSTQLKQNTLIDEYYDDFVKLIEYTKSYAADLDVYDPYVMFKYLRVPETSAEAYVMAQTLWDRIYKYATDNSITTSMNIPYGFERVPEQFRNNVINYAIAGESLSLDALELSKGCGDILRGKCDTILYRYAQPELYSAKFTTPLESDIDFVKMQAALSYDSSVYSTYSSIAEEYYDDAVDLAIRDAYSNMAVIADGLRSFEHNDPDGKKLPAFLRGIANYHNKRREVMTAQIMEYITKSEDNLISHLLFHNFQLHIPVSGSNLHIAQVELLRDMLIKSSDDVPYYFTESNGFIHVGIKKDVKRYILNDSKYADEATTIKISGRDTIYSAPEYKRIDFNYEEARNCIGGNIYKEEGGEIAFYQGANILAGISDSILRNMEAVYKQIDFLTEGKGIGSVGTLHTLNRQHQLYKSLPKDFVDNILTEELSCDARSWHQASFDMSCLGSSSNMWKATDYNDTDPLLSLFNTLEEVTGSATAERMYLGYWNAPESPYKINNVLSGLDDAEKIEILGNLDDMAVVNFNAVDTKYFGAIKSTTGVEVSEIQIKDLTDLKRAEASGAVLVPYDVYLDMQEVFNKSEITNTFLKGWSKMLWTYKVAQLGNPGTWARNWLDATMKMTAETGSAGETARFQLKSAHMLMSYKTISRRIKKFSGLNYTTATDIEREFNRLPAKYRKNMTYEEYKFIDEWLQVSIAGGESRTLKSVKDYTNSTVNLNAALKQGDTSGRMTSSRLEEMKQEYDLIGSKIERFEDLGEDEIKNLMHSSDSKLWENMLPSRFLEIFREGHDIALDDELFEYNEIANKLIEQRFKKIRGKHTVPNILNSICEATFKPMSGIEEIVRFAQYLALEEKGCTRSQIFKSIAASQFNYDNKTMRAKMIEMFIPYYGFMDANLSYWLRALDENPRMLRYVEHIWGGLSWDAAFQYGEDPDKNGSVNYMMAHGGIPIGSSGMYLKTDPSFLQPLNLMLGSPSEYVNTLATPFQYGIGLFLNNGASEYSAFLHEVTDMNASDSSFERFIESLPVVGTLKTRYWDHFTESQPWERLKDAGGIEKFLAKYDPSLFGVIRRYEEDGEYNWKAYLADLEKQGKWWDSNLNKVVPLENKNTEGLNNPHLTFQERSELMFLKFNKVWDANQNRYVTPGEYRPGGLNRTFDLNNSEEWDELCELKKRYLGQVWDYNKRAWVDEKDFKPVMLNDPNLSWEDNQRYHEELFGELYDYNQGKFVQKEQYIKGGLNSKRGTLSFKELCALQYALHGKEYIPGEGFVKTRKPIVQFDVPDLDLNKTIRYDRTDPRIKALERLGLIDPSYGATQNIYRSAPKGVKGRWVLNGDPEHDAAIYADLINNFSDKAPVYGGSRSYQRYGNWRNREWIRHDSGYGKFADFPQMSNNTKFSVPAMKSKRKFSMPYTSGGEYAALRMALYGTKIYEDYYKFEFNYNYNYRSPSAGPKKYYGSLYHAGQYLMRGQRNRSEGKWRYYRR